jgi:hypothetical protein
METEQNFFVYVDYREDDGKPFYVGKGTEKRVKTEKRNSLHTNIKNKHGIIRKVVFESRNEQEAFDKEVQLIHEFQTYVDHGNGGANLTLGGEGVSGYKYSDELREKMSELHKKKWEDPKLREKISESVKKQWEDPEYREKISEKSRNSQKKMWEDPEYREKRRETVKKLWEDPKHSDPGFRKKYGEKMREILSDPEIREKISRITKEKLSNPEIKKKMSEKSKLNAEKLTPEQRSEKIRKGWETRRLKKLQQKT